MNEDLIEQPQSFHFGHLAVVAACVVFLVGIIFLKNGLRFTPSQPTANQTTQQQAVNIQDSDSAQIYGDIQSIIDQSGQSPDSPASKPQVAGAHTDNSVSPAIRGSISQ